MSIRIRSLAVGIAFLAGGLTAAPAFAGTSLFASEANARSVCGTTNVVWAVIDSGHYYKPGSPGYEWGKNESKGAYTCEKVARSRGWHLAKTIQ